MTIDVTEGEIAIVLTAEEAFTGMALGVVLGEDVAFPDFQGFSRCKAIKKTLYFSTV